jgi:ankyrin repeat protein
LQYAAKNGHLSIVQLLVENGARISANDYMALRFATASDHTEIVQYFIEKGANVNQILEVALITASPSFDVVAHLIKNDPKLVHYKFDSPIRRAARYGRLDKVKFFVLQGANIHARNDEAICWALDRGHREIVIYLLEQGAKVFTGKNTRITKNVRMTLPCYDILKNYKGENLDSISEQILQNMLTCKITSRRGKYAEQLNQLLNAYPWIKNIIEVRVKDIQSS